MSIDRFEYEKNLQCTTDFCKWLNPFWPPSVEFNVYCLDILSKIPNTFGQELLSELILLDSLIHEDWIAYKSLSAGNSRPLIHAHAIAESFRRIEKMLPNEEDKRALNIRASAIEKGYDDIDLEELARTNEKISFIAGKISTWYGKQRGGLPTAFGCVRDDTENAFVNNSYKYIKNCEEYVFSLHKHLHLGSSPAFSPTNVFFMAGEGNLHPKHIAYFLPEDEGVKKSIFKKTYYFVNTHRSLVDFVSLPLARRFLNLGKPIPSTASELGPIPTLGVLAHEFGHAVHWEGKNYLALNTTNRWTSVVLQEAAADVFGVLFLSEVLAPAFKLESHDVIMYHLAECLRYTDRGLGLFPDSDGMYFQLNYLVQFGALSIDPQEGVLYGKTDAIIACYRSLARVLADTLLASDVNRTLRLYTDFGPSNTDILDPLISKLKTTAPKTIEYVQEFKQNQKEDYTDLSALKISLTNS